MEMTDNGVEEVYGIFDGGLKIRHGGRNRPRSDTIISSNTSVK